MTMLSSTVSYGLNTHSESILEMVQHPKKHALVFQFILPINMLKVYVLVLAGATLQGLLMVGVHGRPTRICRMLNVRWLLPSVR